MPEVYIGVGSNRAPRDHLGRGTTMLRERFGQVLCSTVYQNPAVGFDGADFLNLVIGLTTAEPLESVVQALRGIEDACGRDRSGPKFGPRTLDLDLLLYGDTVLDAPGVAIPRDEILERAFVLRPLAELAPDLVHPGTGLTMAQHWAAFDDPGADELVALDWQP